ncbi:MAG: flavocytochrome c [Aerococcus sp.]|nr:flavocytochrome c [Aerococcus sp.]
MQKYDVVIVGGGSAGLNAALVVKDAGYMPIVVEKMPKIGGNSLKSSSGMNASETIFQQQQGIVDSNQAFYEETLQGGHGSNDVELLEYFVTHSAQAIEWLKRQGMTLDNLTLLGGMTTKRTHRPHDGSAIGGYLMHRLYERAVENKIPIWTNARVSELLVDERGAIRGVNVIEKDQVAPKTVEAPTVILASGGFGANREWIGRYRPEIKDYVTTNSPGNVGDGIRLAEHIGAATVDMAEIQVHPTVHQESRILIGEAVRGEGGILVNQWGERFVNELTTRDVVSQAIVKQPNQRAYLVFDATVVKKAPALNFYLARHLAWQADQIEEVAKMADVPIQPLLKTIEQWNRAVLAGKDEDFERLIQDAMPLMTAPFGIIPIAPGIHFTMGGIKTNAQAQVLTTAGQPIAGLFAAGEVVGGLHGKNRLGGNAIAETVVFGTRAGQSAVDYLN